MHGFCLVQDTLPYPSMDIAFLCNAKFAGKNLPIFYVIVFIFVMQRAIFLILNKLHKACVQLDR